ncbi:MAG: dockerin type I repeat-containing protein [Oscillospiraceae bacterium]|nr:dockerin type I repeat-containing protein [Oscillospiraceae bacterium]
MKKTLSVIAAMTLCLTAAPMYGVMTYAEDDPLLTLAPDEELPGFLPRTLEDYEGFRENIGRYAFIDSYLLYCDEVNYSLGIDVVLEQDGNGALKEITHYTIETDEMLDGAPSRAVYLYQAVTPGVLDADILYQYPDEKAEPSRQYSGCLMVDMDLTITELGQHLPPLEEDQARIVYLDYSSRRRLQNTLFKDQENPCSISTNIRYTNNEGMEVSSGPIYMVEANPTFCDLAKYAKPPFTFSVYSGTAPKGYLVLDEDIHVIQNTNGSLDIILLARTDISGDVNYDGNVDLADVLLVQEYLTGKTRSLTDMYMYLADMDHNDVVDVRDYSMLKHEVLKNGYIQKTYISAEDVVRIMQKDTVTMSDFETYIIYQYGEELGYAENVVLYITDDTIYTLYVYAPDGNTVETVYASKVNDGMSFLLTKENVEEIMGVDPKKPKLVAPTVHAPHSNLSDLTIIGDTPGLYSGPGLDYPLLKADISGDWLVEVGYMKDNDEWVYVYGRQSRAFGWIKIHCTDSDEMNLSYFEPAWDKPVIYLYPEEETDVHVELELKNATLSTTYPKYRNGWDVTASPDGTLVNQADGSHHKYLFWDATNVTAPMDFSEGFCVAGSDTESFLKEKLTYMGLTEQEMNEFIVYWLPRMEHNAYNLISFQGTAYTDNAVLNITPTPDSVLRVFMAYMPVKEEIEIAPQELESFQRNGFTVVEWGGTEIG